MRELSPGEVPKKPLSFRTREQAGPAERSLDSRKAGEASQSFHDHSKASALMDLIIAEDAVTLGALRHYLRCRAWICVPALEASTLFSKPRKGY